MPNLHERHQIEYSYRREVNELYVSVTIKHIALGLVSIFEPIYIYLHFGGSILPTLLYFGAIYLGFALLSPIAGYIISKIGVKKSIFISIPFVILYFVGLRMIGDVSWMIYILPLLNITYKIFYWTAFHLDFARFSDSKKRGHQVGILRMVKLASKILSPFIGGTIIVFFGYGNLFIVTIIILALSSIPLLMSKEVYTQHPFSFKELLRFSFKKTKLLRSKIAYMAWGSEAITGSLIWPIIMYLIILDYSIIGGIASGVTIVAFLFAFVVGKFVDRWGTKKILRIGAIGTAIGFVARSLTGNAVQVSLADGWYKLSQEATYIGFNSEMYGRAAREESGALTYIIFREFMLGVGRVFTILVCAVIFMVAGSITPTLWFAAFASLFLAVL